MFINFNLHDQHQKQQIQKTWIAQKHGSTINMGKHDKSLLQHLPNQIRR